MGARLGPARGAETQQEVRATRNQGTPSVEPEAPTAPGNAEAEPSRISQALYVAEVEHTTKDDVHGAKAQRRDQSRRAGAVTKGSTERDAVTKTVSPLAAIAMQVSRRSCQRSSGKRRPLPAGVSIPLGRGPDRERSPEMIGASCLPWLPKKK